MTLRISFSDVRQFDKSFTTWQVGMIRNSRYRREDLPKLVLGARDGKQRYELTRISGLDYKLTSCSAISNIPPVQLVEEQV